MRKYTPKDDVQRKSPFSDRFFVSPSVPRLEVTSDEIFAKDYENFSTAFEVEDAYIEHTHLVMIVNKNAIVGVMKHLSEKL